MNNDVESSELNSVPISNIIKNVNFESSFSDGSTITELLAPKDHNHLYSIITTGDEVTWKSIILGLVNDGDMDPWNVDVSKLTKKYLEALKKIKESNLRVSGKVILAAALLLRIKSNRLVGEDLLAFDQMLASSEDDSDMLYQDDDGEYLSEEAMRKKIEREKNFTLVPRTPQPRKRKVSVHDLIDALEQALQVKKRRSLRYQLDNTRPIVTVPGDVVNITNLINDLYAEIRELLLEDGSNLKFTDLCPEDASTNDKVSTFIPLLHLSNARRIDLAQEVHFGEINIKLSNDHLALKELENIKPIDAIVAKDVEETKVTE